MKTKYIVIGLLWGLCNAAWAGLNADLQNAAEEGDVEAIQRLIKQGVDLETRNDRGNTPLKNAVRKNQLEAVKALIEAGADVNTRSNKGSVPLNAAAKRGYLNIVKYLLEHNADVNARGKKGRTSLKIAVMKNRLHVVKALIKAGADLDIQAKNGATALISAAYNDYLPLVQILIAAGADPSFESEKGNTALAHAYENSAGHMKDVLRNHNMMMGEYLSLKSNEITEEAFQEAAKQAFIDKRWSVVSFSPGKVFGVLKKGPRTYRAVISFNGKDILVRFFKGYGSNKTGYLRNLLGKLSRPLGLEPPPRTKRNFAIFLDLGKTGITEDQFKRKGAAAMKRRGWTVTEGPSKIVGEIARRDEEDDTVYKCEMNYDDGEVLVRFVDGFGSNRPNYLRNIQTDLVVSFGLKRAK